MAGQRSQRNNSEEEASQLQIYVSFAAKASDLSSVAMESPITTGCAPKQSRRKRYYGPYQGPPVTIRQRAETGQHLERTLAPCALRTKNIAQALFWPPLRSCRPHYRHPSVCVPGPMVWSQQSTHLST